MEEWKVRIDRPFCLDRLDFYIYRWSRAGFTELMQPDGMLQRINEGCTLSSIKPSFSMGGMDGKQLMQALATALSEEGIKGPNDHAIRGQLEAQTAHLKDLQTILKLNKTSGRY